MNQKKALSVVRSIYGEDNYITGMTEWDGFFIFHIKMKDPKHELEFNTPFSVVVNDKYEVGFCNLAEKARMEGKYEEYVKTCKNNYRTIDVMPDDEKNWLINGMSAKFSKKEAV